MEMPRRQVCQHLSRKMLLQRRSAIHPFSPDLLAAPGTFLNVEFGLTVVNHDSRECRIEVGKGKKLGTALPQGGLEP